MRLYDTVVSKESLLCDGGHVLPPRTPLVIVHIQGDYLIVEAKVEAPHLYGGFTFDVCGVRTSEVTIVDE